MAYPNGTKFTAELASINGGHVLNFNKPYPRYESAKFRKNFLVFFFFVISHTLQKSLVRASILLKFGTHIKGLKANTSIDFWVNLINIEGVISNFTHKSRLKFCQAYRVTASRNKLKIGI